MFYALFGSFWTREGFFFCIKDSVLIDYACGAGHFLTEGFEAVSACVKANDSLRELDRSFAENNIFGIEKDYRLARVSKISLFMHGAGEGNIIFGDGLENYPDKNIKPNTFDILVANPPYSVSAFKPHLKLKNNSFSILDTISNNGSEIETLFVERISQLLKPNAVAAVILPSSILNKENESFICARESILKNFKITIEMHRDVLFRLTNAYDYFADIWERAIHAKGKQYIYEMSLEDHYLHSVCHLAEHFVRGGIGIRMVLDIYILSETPRMDKAYVQRQLKALKLQKFEENIRSLAQLWFSDDEKTVRTEVSDELENYALSGGIFGSRETARRNGTVLYESKNKFVKQLVFPSYEVMKTSCPWLKTPILLPAAWLVRYKRALTASRGNIGYHIERAKTFDRVEDQEQKERCQFFERCGLEDVSENF